MVLALTKTVRKEKPVFVEVMKGARVALFN
jgi:hypothetical protein